MNSNRTNINLLLCLPKFQIIKLALSSYWILNRMFIFRKLWEFSSFLSNPKTQINFDCYSFLFPHFATSQTTHKQKPQFSYKKSSSTWELWPINKLEQMQMQRTKRSRLVLPIIFFFSSLLPSTHFFLHFMQGVRKNLPLVDLSLLSFFQL